MVVRYISADGGWNWIAGPVRAKPSGIIISNAIRVRGCITAVESGLVARPGARAHVAAKFWNKVTIRARCTPLRSGTIVRGFIAH